MAIRKVISFMVLLLLARQAFAQESATADLNAVAREVAGTSGSTFEKTQRLATWINTTFKWSYTDYQKRTVAEIVARRAGNCAELANVLEALLNAAQIRSRWIAEINVHPRTPARQKTAEEKVAQWGKHASVFGLRHNDHRWLEVYEESTQTWFPADPAVGVVGTQQWVAARLGFANRPASPVPEIAAIAKDMLVPFVVIALDSRGGKMVENRAQHYLIEEFDLFYQKKAATLPSWAQWQNLIKQLSVLGASAFAGEVNLHEHGQLIEALAQVYEKLRSEALENKLIAN